MKFYAGIGSRKTPQDILTLMTSIATRLSHDGWVLRSGHADGADRAFEIGASNNAEIYLPWPSFNSHWQILSQQFMAPTQAAMELAARTHPAWHKCGQAARKLHARNMHQILGLELNDPVRFVICWTPLDAQGLPTGGTAQAIRLADLRGIPVFNLFLEEHRTRLERYVTPVGAGPLWGI